MEYGKPFNPFGHFRGLFIPNNIAMSSLSDRGKLLLGRLFQYAGENGEAYPSRKRLIIDLGWNMPKIDRAIKDLKVAGLIDTYQRDEHSPSTYIFLYNKIYEGTIINDSRGTITADSGGTIIDDNHNKFNKQQVHEPRNYLRNPTTDGAVVSQGNDAGKNDSTLRDKVKLVKKVPIYYKHTIELLNYWNDKANLTTHKLAGSRRTVCGLDKQSKVINQINKALRSLFTGKFYTRCADLPERFKKYKPSLAVVKQAIDRCDMAFSSDYSRSGKKIGFIAFLYNEYASLLDDPKKDDTDMKYKYKYPFLYYMSKVPQKLADSPNEAVSKHPMVVHSLVENMKGIGGFKQNNKNLNAVIKYVESAVELIRGEGANGKLDRILEVLPNQICDCMRNMNNGIHIDNLYTAIHYKLIPQLRRNRYLS